MTHGTASSIALFAAIHGFKLGREEVARGDDLRHAHSVPKANLKQHLTRPAASAATRTTTAFVTGAIITVHPFGWGRCCCLVKNQGDVAKSRSCKIQRSSSDSARRRERGKGIQLSPALVSAASSFLRDRRLSWLRHGLEPCQLCFGRHHLLQRKHRFFGGHLRALFRVHGGCHRGEIVRRKLHPAPLLLPCLGRIGRHRSPTSGKGGGSGGRRHFCVGVAVGIAVAS
mmetsp:Transcript_41522/g.81631  ORF Transcript_41522/g.81631 Transcript_41522/m.81631 type:complete len:228 (-) Transcript_41522:99-782(-)